MGHRARGALARAKDQLACTFRSLAEHLMYHELGALKPCFKERLATGSLVRQLERKDGVSAEFQATP